MKIGSHNSFTYLKPRKWWMRLFTIFARCQSKDILEQFEAGVRYFDLRVRFSDWHELIVCHGNMEYKFTQYNLKQFLRYLNRKKDCYLRVIYEVNNNKDIHTTFTISQWLHICLNCNAFLKGSSSELVESLFKIK